MTAFPPRRPYSGERLIGWTAHYLIGIAFAAVLLAIWGLEWARQPTHRARAGRRHRQRGGALPGDAARHGRRHRREPHPAPFRRSSPEPRHPRDLRPRPLRRRLGYKLGAVMRTSMRIPDSLCTDPLRCASLGHHGRHRVRGRPGNQPGDPPRVPVAMVKKLSDDLARGISSRNPRGPLGASNGWPRDGLGEHPSGRQAGVSTSGEAWRRPTTRCWAP